MRKLRAARRHCAFSARLRLGLRESAERELPERSGIFRFEKKKKTGAGIIPAESERLGFLVSKGKRDRVQGSSLLPA